MSRTVTCSIRDVDRLLENQIYIVYISRSPKWPALLRPEIKTWSRYTGD